MRALGVVIIFLFLASLLLLAGCASKLNLQQREDLCLAKMRRAGIPVCHEIYPESPFETGYEIGFSGGYLEGCVDYEH